VSDEEAEVSGGETESDRECSLSRSLTDSLGLWWSRGCRCVAAGTEAATTRPSTLRRRSRFSAAAQTRTGHSPAAAQPQLPHTFTAWAVAL
jgi:hypothetical protein